MKVSVVLTYMLVVAGIFFIFATMVDDANQQYSTNINSSEWEDKYDYSANLNETISPLETQLKAISDTENGWFTKITAGITAIPYAVIAIPTIMFQSITFAGYLVVGTLSSFGIPKFLVSIVLLMISFWAIFKLIEFYQRKDI